MNITDIFFDLDHTLWDFDKNSQLAFQKIFKQNEIEITIASFLEEYIPINYEYWKKYRKDEVSKSDLRYGRLKDTFNALSYEISDEMIYKISEDYIEFLPHYNHLFEDTLEVLDYLSKKYKLHIITNGFEEVQNKKLKESGIVKYFDKVITSEDVGVKKPNPKIFEFSLKKATTNAENSLMIGDSLEADVLGALNYGMHAIYFTNKQEEIPNAITINKLISLKKYL